MLRTDDDQSSMVCSGRGFVLLREFTPGARRCRLRSFLAQPFAARASRESMALTFDDGPNPAATPRILNCWRKYESARHILCDWPARARLSGAGQGNRRARPRHWKPHGNPPSLALLSASGIAEELDRCDEAISSATGVTARWMRPPYGYRSPLLNSIVRGRGNCGVAMWSVAVRDWKTEAAEPRN